MVAASSIFFVRTLENTETNRIIGTKWVKLFHHVKSVRIWSFSGPYFLAFRLITEIYSVNQEKV